MSLQPQHLRDDLAATIAAGRELSPEHDYLLADLFLVHAREALGNSVGSGLAWSRRRLAMVLGAAGLTLAALVLLFSMLAHAAGNHDGGSAPAVVTQQFHSDDGDGVPPGWFWHDDPGFTPQIPSSPPGTNG